MEQDQQRSLTENEKLLKQQTENKDKNEAEQPANKPGWTLVLILCCFCVTTASFQFGYNIASLNSPSVFIKHFIGNHTFLFRVFHEKKEMFVNGEAWIKGNRTLLEDGMYQIEQNEARYIDCSMAWDQECMDEILENKRKKEEALKERFNWTAG
jgi:hypothetical protein